MMTTEHYCTEKPRMERIENKLDRVIDMQINMREDIAVIKPVVPMVQKHDDDIRDLQIKSSVTEQMATRSDVNKSYLLGIGALLVGLLPYIKNIIVKLVGE